MHGYECFQRSLYGRIFKNRNRSKIFQYQIILYKKLKQKKVMKKLSSPHVVKMYDVFNDPKTTYIILEFCKDGDLDHYIRRKGGMLNEKDACDVLNQLLEGFKNLVELGYIHRDIKPANSLVENGVHKVADFGFAKKVDITGRQLIKEAVGTPLYMSPQLLQSQPYTAKSDIWSIGMMFYEMIFGKTPWPCRDLNSFVRNMRSQPLRFPYNKKIGSETKSFLQGCLQYDEAKRFTWDQVLSHPIAKKDTGQIVQPKVNLDQRAQEIIRNMQKVIQAENIDIQKLFYSLDKDYSGQLNTQEFYRLLNKIDPRITTYEANHLFQMIDTSKDGRVSKSEFQSIFVDYDFSDLSDKAEQIITDLREIIKANNIEIQKVFDHHDKDKGGSLDRKEFAYLLRKIAPKLRDFEVEDCLKKFDKDGDGEISFQEFEAQLSFGVKAGGKHNRYNPVEEKSRKIISELKNIIKKYNLQLIQIFNNFDRSKDGMLDKSEFTKFIHVIDKSLYQQDIEIIYQKFDKNGDGISFNEFRQVLE
ncbi:Protein kinase-like domain [Pseudocohnilembus persalinus]|uniref:Protein kinase-like domain n=1 Tax=Pseudocohnilembus persalinus TaxID=266149 RepID=A0A0V0QHL6_PSEPJ|nr:Protein kinase-like domain [Pseudocohnilembus persalinus]|eukprot:KRX01735.1 Protein kinase-like domain [Pseudocohnilembus persalinus]